MTVLKKSALIDRLIAESKQVTADLMALRHEMQRRPDSPFYLGGPRDRAFLISSNIYRMADDIRSLGDRLEKREIETEPEYIKPRPRALENGQLRLGNGGR